MVKREMRNQYEYELGLLTGMNEAIMNQNDQMRERILQQNAKIQEVKFLRFLQALLNRRFLLVNS